MHSRNLTWTSGIALAAILAVFAVFMVYPLFYAIKGAFIVNGEFSLEFFGLMFTNPVHREAIWNSTLVGLTVTAATTIVALPVAFVMVRREFPGRAIFNGLLLVPMVMPPFVGRWHGQCRAIRLDHSSYQARIDERSGTYDWLEPDSGFVVLEVLTVSRSCI